MKGQNLKALQKELTRDEAERLKLYKCSEGKLTIGIGHNIEDLGIKKEVSDLMFKLDVEDAEKHCQKYVWYAALSPARKRVVVNMMFNLGATRFSKFKKTISYLRAGDFNAASVEMLDSKWARQVGIRAKRLSKMMKEG